MTIDKRLLIVLPTLVFAGFVYAQSPGVEIVAQLDQSPGNITVTPDGRLVMSMAQHFSPEMRVAEYTKEGKLVPFPNADWSLGGNKSRIAVDTVLGIQCDPEGVVWMLDNGVRGGTIPKVIGWDTRTDSLKQVIHLPPPVVPDNNFMNDLAVDLTHQAIYIADTAGGTNSAIIVVDLKTGLARRVLEGHTSVMPETDIEDLVIDGQPVQIRQQDGSLVRPRIGINPIALDVKNEWLYYSAMHSHAMYRVRTADLLNDSLSVADIGKSVERYCDKPLCDGMAVDSDGNLYLAMIGDNAIGVITKDKKLEILIQDDRILNWPDSFTFGPDGYMYTVANQLHRSQRLNGGQETAKPPYYILKFKPLAPGVIGR